MDSRPSPTPRTSPTSEVSPITAAPSGAPASPGSPSDASPLPKRVVRGPRRSRFTNGAFDHPLRPLRPLHPLHGPRPDSLARVLQRVTLLGMLAVRNPSTHGDTARHLTPGEARPHRRALTDAPGRRNSTPAEGAQISGSPLSG